jgi:hypothetical protein
MRSLLIGNVSPFYVPLETLVESLKKALNGLMLTIFCRRCHRYLTTSKSVAIQLGVRAGGSHGPVVNSWCSASSLLMPHLVAVSR